MGIFEYQEEMVANADNLISVIVKPADCFHIGFGSRTIYLYVVLKCIKQF